MITGTDYNPTSVEVSLGGFLVIVEDYPTTDFTVWYDYESPPVIENDIPYKSRFWLWLRELLPESPQPKIPYVEPNLQNKGFYRRSAFSKSGYLPARVRSKVS